MQLSLHELSRQQTPAIKIFFSVWIIASVMCWIVVVLHFMPFFADDAFISLRYAERFTQGHGLTWNDGEHVEGYSNLLWILLISLIGFPGFDLVTVARILGIACFVGIVSALWLWSKKSHLQPLAFAGVAAFLSTCMPLVIWSIAGLEACLYALLLLCATLLLLYAEQQNELQKFIAVLIGLCLGLMVITRPEGIIMAMSYCIAILFCCDEPRQIRFRKTTITIVITLGFYLSQLLFRIFYYGDYVPNTYYAKVAFNMQRLQEGFWYVLSGLSLFWPIGIILVYAGYKARHTITKNAFLILGLPPATWFTLVVCGGGDIFPAYRHLVPFLVLITPLLALSLNLLFLPSQRIYYVSLLLLALSASAWLQYHNHEINKASTERWEWPAKELGEYLHQHFEKIQPVVAITAAGAIAYYDKLPSLDLFGLNDSYLAHHKPKNFGHGALAHELWNEDYILSRSPEIITFFPSEALFHSPKFLEMYAPYTVKLPSASKLFVRKDFLPTFIKYEQ